MKNTIIFFVEVDNECSYNALANFIYKRESHMDLTREEIYNVTYKYYLNNKIQTEREWVKAFTKDKNSFKHVQRPGDIKNITEQFEVIYCLNISVEADIVNLCNLYLIRHYYEKLKMIALFNNYSDAKYYEVSQFLYHVNYIDQGFYKSCYFTGKNVKQAQLQNIQFSRRFIPLQIVNQDNINRLFQKSDDFLDESYIQEILTRENVGELNKIGNDLLEGAVKLLHDVRKKLSAISAKRIMQLVRKTDVFSFILLCYVVCTKKGSFQFEVLEKYVYDMQQYSTAIRQLAENIVFHAETKSGIIAFRIHDSSSNYMDTQYHVKNGRKEYGFLEIIVSDFCGNNGTKNIVENFTQNITDPFLKEKFSNLCPAAFFMHGDEESTVWEQFYSNPDNIGKHFGLRIFQSVVTAFGGLFGAESHSGYVNQQGDFYSSYDSNVCSTCMPGTKYRIVFPVGQGRKTIEKQDLSLDSGINISTNIRTILGYSTGNMILNYDLKEPKSQEQKNQIIRGLSEKLRQGLSDNNQDILYVSANNVGEGMGEILAKAFVMALFQIKRNVRIVLYQCSERMIRVIFDTLKVFFDSTDMEGMFYGIICQLILYSTEYEETVVDLGNAVNTDSINTYISHVKCIRSDKWMIRRDGSTIDLNKGAMYYVPCDVLREVLINGKNQTLFEHYTEMILEKNIQSQDFGCKFEHTHMRLGSTIHIEKFYEAEILFGNKLFISRFALLLFKDMQESIRNVKKLTLYGYGTYSEAVLVQMRDMILSYYKDGRDVDYIILEREEERRGFLHKDRIRYNRLFASDEARIEYFADRKLAIVVLINSTLKTHARLISMFRDENRNEKNGNEEWLIRNYAVILAGNAQGNGYWKLAENKEIKMQTNGVIPIVPAPRYFIQLQVDYKEPIDCDYCFPLNPLAELPLIEVNAASTIPNQAYGIVQFTHRRKQSVDANMIRLTEKRLKYLNNQWEEGQTNPTYNFAYGHLQRNENHFLYYFRTENIWVNKKAEIEESLRIWKSEHYSEEMLQYNILVAPMHYSNAGFVELVNNTIFQGNAILLRIDFDKEYRCNAYTKFSYLRNYVKQLLSIETHSVLSVHFIDDSIISGKTFHRAKSLMESILKVEQTVETSLEIKIFDKVFVLIDRNSRSSRIQYVREPEKDFYSFLQINISSLRNHGDSCVVCNLKKEADLLGSTASTASVGTYWENQARKFRLLTLEEYDQEKKKKQENVDVKAFRRLFCTDMARQVLAEEYHGNDQAMTAYQILNLINTDYISRESERYEYFLSYLKCISRPFLVFKKSIKEAVFDILLILMDAVVRKKAIRDVIKEVEEKKPYLKERYLIQEFNQLDKIILNAAERTEKNRQDLVKLLMKQLTELKSNYIIRPERMDVIFNFMCTVDSEKFKLYYISLICRLVGASSDTNKSIWLDAHLNECKVSDEFKTWVSLENTRTLRDGIEKFYIKWNVLKEFKELSEKRLAVLREINEMQVAERMFANFIERNRTELADDENLQNTDKENDIEESIQHFLRKLPVLGNIDFYDDAMGLRKLEKSWKEIWKSEQKQLIKNMCSQEQYQDGGLSKVINEELDIYQYNNFRKILEDENYISKGKINQNGVDMIICCMKILELCRTSDWPILSKVQELTTLFKVILGAEKVQFIVENKAENTLEEWKKTIEERFNKLAKDRIAQNENLAIHIKTRKHYVLIREQTGTVVFDEELSAETERILDTMEQGKNQSHNYIIDRESGITIWKLSNKERCIWVSMESAVWKDMSSSRFKVEHDLRKVMMFYQELRQKIFSPENDDYINEISNAHKELKIYNSNRVYTHTRESLLQEQYEQIYKYYTQGDKEYDELYPAYVLKLISDIIVSKYYRRGLRKMRAEMTWKPFAEWGELSEFFTDKKEFFYRMEGNEKLFVKIKVSKINGNEKILCGKDDKDAISNLTLLIYAIILNAAERNRGRREKAGKENEITKQRVVVKLIKEAHYLVIQNDCMEEVDIEQVKYKLRHVPESEEDGISLWSMNCYIKQCINNWIMAILSKAEADVSENAANEKQLLDLKRWIEMLTGETFTIQPNVRKENGKTFFEVKIPLFMGGYPYGDSEKERGEQYD